MDCTRINSMELIAFYEFLPTKDREIEMQEKGASISPPSVLEFIPCRIWQTQQIDFLKQLRNENEFHPKIQLEDELPPPPVWHIVKTLKTSDIDHLCRLLFTQEHIAALCVLWDPIKVQNLSKGEKLDVLIKDADAEFFEHWVVFGRWQSNRMYVMQSSWHAEFVVRRGLKACDLIGLSWDSESCFLFSVLRRG